jgi:hypothetical protein
MHDARDAEDQRLLEAGDHKLLLAAYFTPVRDRCFFRNAVGPESRRLHRAAAALELGEVLRCLGDRCDRPDADVLCVEEL